MKGYSVAIEDWEEQDYKYIYVKSPIVPREDETVIWNSKHFIVTQVTHLLDSTEVLVSVKEV